MTRLFALAGLLLAVTASSGAAATPTRAPILGVVPHVSQAAAAPEAMLLSKMLRARAGPATLTFDASYETLINRYFADVAHDSGGSANVYSVATQYSDNSGPIQYQSTFGGSYVDRDPLPKNGCSAPGVDKYCLTDTQIQKEIQSVMTANGWQGGLNHIFFLMTPNGVASCFNAAASECSTNAFCAYHSAFLDSAGADAIYANVPYEGPAGGCADASQGFPNNPDADTAVNLISHEHNESITDPLDNGWFANDLDQDEEADLCAYGFGAPLGGTPGIDAYNQVINGHHYDLQEEFSNADDGCVQHFGGPASPPPDGDGSGPLVYQGGSVMHTNTTYAIYWVPTAVPAVKKAPHILGRARVGRKLSGHPGSWTYFPKRYDYQWLRCNAHGGSCSSIRHATHSTYRPTRRDAGHRLRLRVTATNVAGSKAALSTPSARVRS